VCACRYNKPYIASLHGAAQKNEEQSPGVLSLHEIITPKFGFHQYDAFVYADKPAPSRPATWSF
jgi:hypothetical protein